MTQSSSPNKDFPRQAIVLAAGLGTRLRPLTYRIPKPAMPVGGVPILFFNFYLLKSLGLRNITVNLHHLPDRLKRLLSRSKALGLNISYSFEKKILGTGGGIAKALKTMKKRTTIILNGDIVTDLNLADMFNYHLRSGAKATLACVPRDRAKVHSFVEFNASGRILRIAGKPQRRGLRTKLIKGIFSGAHILEPELFDHYPNHDFGCIIRKIYQPSLQQDQPLQAYFHQGAWWDLGNLDELKRVDRLLWNGEVSVPMRKLWAEVYDWSRPLFSSTTRKGGLPTSW